MICIVYVTKKGKIKISTAEDIRVMGRLAKGVIGVNLDEGDEVVASYLIDKEIEPKFNPKEVPEPEAHPVPAPPVESVEAPVESNEGDDEHGGRPLPADF